MLYLGVVAALTALIVAAALHGAPAVDAWMLVVVALLTAFPASEAALGLVNRVVSESARPRRLAAQGLHARHPAGIAGAGRDSHAAHVGGRYRARSSGGSRCTIFPTPIRKRSSRC